MYCTLTLTLYPLSKRVPAVLGWEPGKKGKRVPWDSLITGGMAAVAALFVLSNSNFEEDGDDVAAAASSFKNLD